MPLTKINGDARNMNADPQMPLLWAIRNILGLTGTTVSGARALSTWTAKPRASK